MSAPRLTAEQEAPVGARAVSVALAAGAGCGKTFVLTQRFVSLLEGDEPIDLARIVALTFTDKAARELRQRVRETCRKRLAVGTDAARWRSVVRDLESARIGTFHSFCGDVLRLHATEAGIDPGFGVMDEAVAPTVRARALDAATRRWLAERDPDFAALAIDYGTNAIRDALSSALASPPDFDINAWAERDPAEVLAIWERYRDRTKLVPLLNGLAAEHRATARLLAASECANAVMRGRCARLAAALAALETPEATSSILAEILEDAKVQGGGKAADWPDPETYEEVKTRLTSLREDVRALAKLNGDLDASREAAGSAGRFARLLRALGGDYRRAKGEEGVLDFDDLQSLVLDLLRRDDGRVRDSLRGSIDALLVDEFQDTDGVQAEILNLLTAARPSRASCSSWGTRSSRSMGSEARGRRSSSRTAPRCPRRAGSI